MEIINSQSRDSKRIRDLRKKLALSQRELATLFGVSAGAVAHWELGKRQISGPVLKLLELYEQNRIEKLGR